MSSCMDKYKNEFAIKFAQIMGKQLHVWKNVQNSSIRSLYSIPAILTYLGVGLLGFIPGKHEHNYNLEMHIWLAVVFFISAIIGNIQITNKEYQDSIKKTLFPELLKIFGNIYYALSTVQIEEIISNATKEEIPDISSDTIPNSEFENSKLYPRTIMQRDNDDCFFGNYNDVGFKINETDFGYITRGKNETYHRMFKGIAMHFKMNKKIKARVLILSKFSGTNIPKNYEKVEVEYEKFNKKYDVWAEKNIMGGSGQIEARYLLNTAFLDRFMQIQTSFRVKKMCCSVFDDSMLIMLSTGRDLFEMNHLFGRIDDVKQYRHLFDEFASVLSFIEVLNLSSKTKL